MGVDLRQVVAGILTITMFIMLGQMLHRDYYDSLQVSSLLPTNFLFCFLIQLIQVGSVRFLLFNIVTSMFLLILLSDAF